MAISAIAHRWVRVSRKCEFYGPGYRVYFAQRGIELVILLAGGDKAKGNVTIETLQRAAALVGRELYLELR
jgi:putative addiction module killer protein